MNLWINLMDEVAWDEQSNIAAVHQQHKSISIRSLEWADWFDLICCGHCRPLRIENGIILWNEIMEWTMKQRSCDWWKESLFFLNWWVMAAASGRGSANEREQTNFLWFMSNKVGELFLSERERAPIKSTKLICGGRSASQKETSPRELPFLFFSAGAQPKRKRKRTAR